MSKHICMECHRLMILKQGEWWRERAFNLIHAMRTNKKDIYHDFKSGCVNAMCM